MPILYTTLLSSPPYDAFAIFMHLVSSHTSNKNVLYFVAVYQSVNDDDVMSENENETEDDAF